jgi:SAM-dependent methyltransferase
LDNATLEMQANWQKYHQEQKVTALTGSHVKDYCMFHGLDKSDFAPGVNVLEVGVGLGHASKEMTELRCKLFAMDICERALETVKPVTIGTFLHSEADHLPSNYFDLIIHHLVTQHMSDTDLKWQLPNLIRSLTSTGELHIQWAGSDVSGENDIEESIVGVEGEPDKQNTPSMMGGRMVRSVEHATELIEQAGGKVICITDTRKWPEFSSSWFSMKVMKK